MLRYQRDQSLTASLCFVLSLALAYFVLALSLLAIDYISYRQLTVTGVVNDTAVRQIGSSVAYHKLSWNVSGTVSACSVKIDTSADAVTWTPGGAVAAQTCTSNGLSSVAGPTVANYVRISVTSFTGTGSVVVAYSGYVNNPTPTGGTVTAVTGTAPIVSSGGATPGISCVVASGSVSGCLAAADFTTFNNKQAGPLTGDVTTSGAAATLANTAVTAGTYGDSTHIPSITFDAKGRATAASQSTFSAGSSSGAAGYIQLSGGSGAFTSDSTTNAGFFWNTTTHRLGIGTATPAYLLDLNAQSNDRAPQLHILGYCAGCTSATEAFRPWLTIEAGGNGTVNNGMGYVSANNAWWTGINAGTTGETGFFTLAHTSGGNGFGLGPQQRLIISDVGVAVGVTGIDYSNSYAPAAALDVAKGKMLVDSNGKTSSTLYGTITNCSNAASPAVCASAPAGVVAVPTGTNPTLTINTTAVTANSRIFLQIDESATIAATTCNTTLSTLVQPVVTARTAATSFTIQIGAVIAANPVCVSYFIVN